MADCTIVYTQANPGSAGPCQCGPCLRSTLCNFPPVRFGRSAELTGQNLRLTPRAGWLSRQNCKKPQSDKRTYRDLAVIMKSRIMNRISFSHRVGTWVTSLTICIDRQEVRSRSCCPMKTSSSSHSPIDIRLCLTNLQSSDTMLSPSHRVLLCYLAS